jgi:hypothetical protein
LKAEDKFYLNTGKQILKEILDTKKKFIHIHPGYLPLVKGADGSLHSIDKFDFLGVSSFIMEKKIDHGKIIEREKLSLPYFKLKNFEKYKIADIYRIWFAFVDPLLRTYHLRNLVEKKIDIHNNQIYPNHTKENENYFTFMSNAELERTFKKIFLN